MIVVSLKDFFVARFRQLLCVFLLLLLDVPTDGDRIIAGAMLILRGWWKYCMEDGDL